MHAFGAYKYLNELENLIKSCFGNVNRREDYYHLQIDNRCKANRAFQPFQLGQMNLDEWLERFEIYREVNNLQMSCRTAFL